MSGKNMYDAVVIGAGHNGLTCAAYLARQGRKVLILEKRTVTGGLAAGREFHPGYKSPGALLQAGGFSQIVMDELGLAGYGLRSRPGRPDVLLLPGQGRALPLFGEPRRAAEYIRLFSEHDADKYLGYRSFIDDILPVIREVIHDRPLDLDQMGRQDILELLKKGWSMKKVGRSNLMELMRLAPMPLVDFLEEWFENDLLKAGLALPALEGIFAGPWSPGTVTNLLLAESLVDKTVVGGPAAVAEALEKSAMAAGAEIRTGVEVESLTVNDGRVAGVVAGGDSITADMVMAGCDPRVLLGRLIPRTALGGRLYQRGQGLRGHGHLARVDLALNARLELPGPETVRPKILRFASNLTAVEKAFDRAKYGGLAQRPIMEAHLFDSETGAAPDGHEVAAIQVYFAPYDLKTGWTPEAGDNLREAVLSILGELDQDIREKLVAASIMTPVDLESEYSVVRGCLHHVEPTLDQMYFRPFVEASRVQGLLPGLHICGSGGHPAGGITGLPGRLAAKAA